MVINVKDYGTGHVLFAMGYEQKGDEEYAKEFCRENNLTPDDVQIKIIGKKDKIIVVTVK